MNAHLLGTVLRPDQLVGVPVEALRLSVEALRVSVELRVSVKRYVYGLSVTCICH